MAAIHAGPHPVVQYAWPHRKRASPPTDPLTVDPAHCTRRSWDVDTFARADVSASDTAAAGMDDARVCYTPDGRTLLVAGASGLEVRGLKAGLCARTPLTRAAPVRAHMHPGVHLGAVAPTGPRCMARPPRAHLGHGRVGTHGDRARTCSERRRPGCVSARDRPPGLHRGAHPRGVPGPNERLIRAGAGGSQTVAPYAVRDDDDDDAAVEAPTPAPEQPAAAHDPLDDASAWSAEQVFQKRDKIGTSTACLVGHSPASVAQSFGVGTRTSGRRPGEIRTEALVATVC